MYSNILMLFRPVIYYGSKKGILRKVIIDEKSINMCDMSNGKFYE